MGMRYAGREKGTPNKRTSDLIELLKQDAHAYGEDGWHPVIYMQRIAMGVAEDESTLSDRITCAKEVARYIAPQRKPVDADGSSREYVLLVKDDSDREL